MSDAPARIPLVMCTWRRPEYFRRTLRALAAQADVSVELHVWNNNPAISEQLGAAAAEGPLPVRFHHSPENIGGFGRFHLARELAPSHPHVVFIDDDQLFGPRTIRTLVGEARPRTATGWWAYRFLFPPHYLMGWTLRRSRATFWFIPDTRNQFAGLIREKYEFLRYLTARGWLQRPG